MNKLSVSKRGVTSFDGCASQDCVVTSAISVAQVILERIDESYFCRIMGRPTVADKIRVRIQRSRRDVFLRRDFSDLGSYDTIGRGLRQMIREGTLIKVGYGIYSTTKPSILDGNPIPKLGVRPLLKEVLHRLGAQPLPSTAEQNYNSGKSTQVPTGRVIGFKGKRINRKLGYNNIRLGLERLNGTNT